MKFLHTIAEGFLYLMNKKWNSYMYLEPGTTVGKFEAGILKFVVTIRPLQFTHCAEIRFLRHCLWKSIVTFTFSNSFLCNSIQNTTQCIVLYSIFSSTLQYVFTAFPAWHLLLCTDETWVLRFSHQLSVCRWCTVYGMVSPHKSACWTLTLACPYCH
jgi:hypothetical protein